ncbi:MAG: site-specific tyrosine recombinase/integron integrase [bacterium]
MATQNSLKGLIQDFLDYLEGEKNCSPLTTRNYHSYLTDFANSMKVSQPAEITDSKLRDYRVVLNRRKNSKGDYLKHSTKNYYLIALRSFLKYLAKRDIKSLMPEKIELAKVAGREIDFLEPEELARLLDAPDAGTMRGLRDKAILELLFSSGLRVSELCSLDTKKINLKKDEFSIRGKGDKLRVVFLSNTAKYWLKKYNDARQDGLSPLFISYPKGKASLDVSDPEKRRLTPRSIQRLVHKYALIAGITTKVTPHVLRHSYATDLLMGGADIRSVQAMLGHASITTTQMYTHITDKRLREVYKKFHGKTRRGE